MGIDRINLYHESNLQSHFHSWIYTTEQYIIM